MSQDENEAYRKLRALELKITKELKLWNLLYHGSRGYLGGKGRKYCHTLLDALTPAREKADAEYGLDPQ